MNVSGTGGREELWSTAPPAGRDIGSGLRKIADPGRIAGAEMHPRGNLCTALRGFRSGQSGGVTVEGAIALSVLVAAFAALMGIVHETYIEDRMARGARAGARAVSLAATAPASEKALKDIVCRAVARELGEDEGKDCACWSIEVEAFATPQALSAGEARGSNAPHGGENLDMVLVRMSRSYWDWLSDPVDTGADSKAEADLEAEADTEVDSCPDASNEAGIIVVAAVARNEREVRVSR